MTGKAIDFNWEGQEREQVLPGYSRTGIGNEKVNLFFSWFEPDAGSMEPHTHDYDQFTLVLDGSQMILVTDGAEHVMNAGDLLYIPAGVWHCGENRGPTTARTLDIFAPPRQDYAHVKVGEADSPPAE